MTINAGCDFGVDPYCTSTLHASPRGPINKFDG